MTSSGSRTCVCVYVLDWADTNKGTGLFSEQLFLDEGLFSAAQLLLWPLTWPAGCCSAVERHLSTRMLMLAGLLITASISVATKAKRKCGRADSDLWPEGSRTAASHSGREELRAAETCNLLLNKAARRWGIHLCVSVLVFIVLNLVWAVTWQVLGYTGAGHCEAYFHIYRYVAAGRCRPSFSVQYFCIIRKLSPFLREFGGGGFSFVLSD